MKFKTGDRFYSMYFKNYGTVTKYINDKNWWFKLDGSNVELKAQSTPDKLKWIDRNTPTR